MNAEQVQAGPQAAPAIRVNGKDMPLGDVATLADLLRRLDTIPERVVVELNGTIHRRGEGLDSAIRGGDVVEIVHFVGGG